MESWLAAELEGAATVRGELARRLAAQIDDPATASYVVPRLSAELRGVVAELEGERGVGDARVRKLLREVR